MSLRRYLAAIGVVVALAGLVLLALVPVSAKDSAGTKLQCGTALTDDERAALEYNQQQRQRELAATLDVVTGMPTSPGFGTPRGGYTAVTPPDCEGAQSSRMTLGIVVALAGLAVAGGAALVRSREASEPN